MPRRVVDDRSDSEIEEVEEVEEVDNGEPVLRRYPASLPSASRTLTDSSSAPQNTFSIYLSPKRLVTVPNHAVVRSYFMREQAYDSTFAFPHPQCVKVLKARCPKYGAIYGWFVLPQLETEGRLVRLSRVHIDQLMTFMTNDKEMLTSSLMQKFPEFHVVNKNTGHEDFKRLACEQYQGFTKRASLKRRRTKPSPVQVKSITGVCCICFEGPEELYLPRCGCKALAVCGLCNTLTRSLCGACDRDLLNAFFECSACGKSFKLQDSGFPCYSCSENTVCRSCHQECGSCSTGSCAGLRSTLADNHPRAEEA